MKAYLVEYLDKNGKPHKPRKFRRCLGGNCDIALYKTKKNVRRLVDAPYRIIEIEIPEVKK